MHLPNHEIYAEGGKTKQSSEFETDKAGREIGGLWFLV